MLDADGNLLEKETRLIVKAMVGLMNIACKHVWGNLTWMKKYRKDFIVSGILVLIIASMLIEDDYKARKNLQETLRTSHVVAIVNQKKWAYHATNGYYPSSIDILSFTNSPQEIDILPDLKKIRYRITRTDFVVRWERENQTSQ